MLNDDLHKSLNIFLAKVYSRASKGVEEYGDKSFDRPSPQLISEIQEEVADIAGWGWVLYHRLEQLKKRVEEIDGQST